MPDIRLTVPFAYRAKVLRPRKRNPEDVEYVAHVDVCVREASGSEAPVAFRCELPGTRFDGLQDHRWFDDALWRPLHTSERSGEPETHRDVAWLRGRVSEPRHHGMFGSLVDPLPYGRPPLARMEDDPALGRVLEDGRVAAEERLRQSAADAIVVEGSLWQRAPEPVLVTSWCGRARYLEASVGQEVTHDTYRIDQADRMLALRPLGDVEQMYALPEVLMPEVLRMRVTERVLLRTMEELTGAMGRHVLQGDRDYFDAYAALRDGAAALARDLGADEVGDVAAACGLTRTALDTEQARVGADGVAEVRRRVGDALARVAMDGLDASLVETMRI